MARVVIKESEVAAPRSYTLGPVKSKIVAATYKDGRFGPQISIRTEHGYIRDQAPFRSTEGVTDSKDLGSIKGGNARLVDLLLATGYTKAQVQAVLSGKGLLVLNESAPVEQDGLADKQPNDVILTLVGRDIWILNAPPDVNGSKYNQPVAHGSEKQIKERWNAAGGATQPLNAIHAIAKAEGVTFGRATTPANRRTSAQEAEDEAPVSGNTDGEVTY